MKLDLNRSNETSRFLLALILSSATALLVAAPFLIVMVRSDNEPTVKSEAPERSTEETKPLPSLGNDESEVGRIGEAEAEPQQPAPRPPAPASPVEEEPPPPQPQTTVTTPEPPETTTDETTTTVDPTTTAPDTPVEPTPGSD